MTKRAIWALALALVIACGGGGEGGPSDTTVGTDPPETPAGDGEESLADFFGGPGDDPEAAQAEFRDQEARIQEIIRQCMAEQGFEYQPVMPPEESFQVWDETSQEEMVREQGFGITTWYGNEEEFGGGDVEWTDPNQEMLDEMSDSERQAWQEALWGTPEEQEEDMTTEVDPETGETMYISEGFGAGCQGEAYEAEYGDQNASQELWDQLQPAFDEMYQRVEADPRIVEANQEWASCMADRGFEYESRQTMHETIYDDFQARLDEIIGPGGGFSDPFEGWTEDEVDAFFEESTQEEIDAFFRAAEEESRENIDMEALAALQQEEIDLAVADFECGEELNDLYQEVSAEYEVDFIAENREVLEQIREAQGG